MELTDLVKSDVNTNYGVYFIYVASVRNRQSS